MALFISSSDSPHVGKGMVDDTSHLVTGVDCLGIVKVEFEADDSSGLLFDGREEDCNKGLAL